MRYSSIREIDISNGWGVRVSLFVQGCDFHCKNCFNQETWDWNSGKEFTSKELDILMKLCSHHYVKGLSILGGEPLHPNNINTVTEIAKRFKELYPNKDLWVWSGYTFENYIKDKEVTKYVDMIVDGRFEYDKKDLNLKFRGSSNQRIINVQESLKQNKIVLWEE